jgi:hypothetical protein
MPSAIRPTEILPGDNMLGAVDMEEPGPHAPPPTNGLWIDKVPFWVGEIALGIMYLLALLILCAAYSYQ